jgi:hypothetical protein
VSGGRAVVICSAGRVVERRVLRRERVGAERRRTSTRPERRRCRRPGSCSRRRARPEASTSPASRCPGVVRRSSGRADVLERRGPPCGNGALSSPRDSHTRAVGRRIALARWSTTRTRPERDQARSRWCRTPNRRLRRDAAATAPGAIRRGAVLRVVEAASFEPPQPRQPRTRPSAKTVAAAHASRVPSVLPGAVRGCRASRACP